MGYPISPANLISHFFRERQRKLWGYLYIRVVFSNLTILICGLLPKSTTSALALATCGMVLKLTASRHRYEQWSHQ